MNKLEDIKADIYFFCTPHISPCVRMWGAVVRQSVIDAVKGSDANKQAALRWLFLDTSGAVGSLDWILKECFNRDPCKFRAKLLATYIKVEDREILADYATKKISSRWTA